MQREELGWRSDRLRREMRVLRYGDFGVPLILFPPGRGDHTDNEQNGLIAAIEPFVEARRIKVYAVDAITRDAWLSHEATPWHRSWLQARYDAYLVNELLPRIRDDSGGYVGYIAAGASIGAYNAVNVACKHPDWFQAVLGMSGTYDFDRWMGHHRDQEYYYNQPLYFLPGLPRGLQRLALQQVRFLLACGRGRSEAPWESERLTGLLRAHEVHCDLDLWGLDDHHEWPTWRRMLPVLLERVLP